jgi:hypothetical protein
MDKVLRIRGGATKALEDDDDVVKGKTRYGDGV